MEGPSGYVLIVDKPVSPKSECNFRHLYRCYDSSFHYYISFDDCSSFLIKSMDMMCDYVYVFLRTG